LDLMTCHECCCVRRMPMPWLLLLPVPLALWI
jgi:hypothetical protein